MRRYIIDINFSQKEMVKYIETFEQDFYPVFFCNKTSFGYKLGYGNKQEIYSEFLYIDIDESKKIVTIERDLKATLILFYYYHNKRLIISSDYNYFAQQLKLKNMLDLDYIKMFLGHGKSATGSICKHISILYPRKNYQFFEESIHISDVSYTHKKINIDDILIQNFCNLNNKNIVGAEISGGKDSGFLPILAKKSKYFPFKFISGQLHTGEVGKQQRNTLSKIIDFLDVPYEYHYITDIDYPLKNEYIGVIKHPLEEIYKNSLLGEIQILKKHGINTIFNGFGGDEAFESKEYPNDYIEIDPEILSFIFNESFIGDINKLNNSDRIYNDSVFQTSVYESLICRNNIYIQNGIRPITPYLNIDIYEYLQSLKVSKQQFFINFYNTFDEKLKGAFDKNTNMGEYFTSYFESSYFNNLLQSCILDEESLILGYYNTKNLKTYFSNTTQCSDALVQTYDFFLYKFVALSLMLR